MDNLVASAARTTSAGSSTFNYSGAKMALFYLTVTADESTFADKLDVYLQSTHDGGTTWQDFAAFEQQSGTAGGSGLVNILTWERGTVDSESQTTSVAALTAGTVVKGPTGPDWRVYWKITDDSGSAGFTFQVDTRIIHR